MKLVKKILFSFIILALPVWSVAQCSVCKAGLISNAKTGGNTAQGINEGILYLLGITYLMFTAFAIYYLREHIKFYYRTAVQRWRMFIASR